MSLLPQRKKSVEEIAKLRESLGIPALQLGEEALPVEPLTQTPGEIHARGESTSAAVPDLPTAELAPIPQVETHEPKVVRSLRRSERIPVLPVVDPDSFEEIPAPAAPEPIPTSSPLPVAQGPKPVRSLRKSEQVPLPAIQRFEVPVDSKLPAHRHSEREISAFRRQEAIAMQGAHDHHPASLTAHVGMIIPGYLFAVVGAVCFYFYELQLPVPAGCVAVSLVIAAYIFVRKPLSRHHAAFISVAALFVIVFGALHYFPNLQYGT